MDIPNDVQRMDIPDDEVADIQNAVNAGLIVVVLAGLILNFFRDPERSTPAEDHIVVSPADGTVLEVATVNGEGYGEGQVIRIDPHSSSDDQRKYREEEELQELTVRDPLYQTERYLYRHKIFSP